MSDSRPIPKVSPDRYTSTNHAPDRPARVRIRIKGSGNPGRIYQGQRIVGHCEGCGGK